jgi:hypothetical protein
MITDLIVGLMATNPTFTAFLTIMGLLRAVNKPVFATIQALVDATETKADDKWWAKMQEHKAMRALLWVLDWTASVKVPKGK